MRLLASVLLCAFIISCDSITGRSKFSWTEDVLLDDGSTISVRRFVRTETAGSQFAGGAYDVEQKATLQFLGTSAEEAVWDYPLMALVVYRDPKRNEWAIIATSQSCEVITERAQPRLLFAPARPPTIYFEFRLRKGRWVQVPLSPGSIGRKSNLVFSYRQLESNHVAIDAQIKATSAWEPYKAILETYERGLGCGNTTMTQPLREIEDNILAATTNVGATPAQTDAVGELLASTRILYERGMKLPTWRADADPNTVQILVDSFLNGRKPGVSADGQVIFVVISPTSNAEESESLKLSYDRRLKAVGLGQYSPLQLESGKQ